MIEQYPTSPTDLRPFYIEMHDKSGEKNIFVQLFKRASWKGVAVYKDSNSPIDAGPHPWNLGLEGWMIAPGYISFWTEEFLKFMVDALNDKYERENLK